MQLEIARLVGGVGRSDPIPTSGPFHLLGMALTFRDSETTHWLGEVVVQSRENMCFGRKWASDRRDPFRCYICELYCRNAGKSGFPDNFGQYGNVFEAWQQPAELADAIHLICDRHVEQINMGDPDEIGEFENNPYDIFPSEILALYRVREKLGLATPSVKHPLLDTPFVNVPKDITCEPEPLVVQAMDFVTKLLPEAVAKR